MALVYFFTFLINLVFIQGRTEVERLFKPFENQTHLSIYANALSKAHYNPWACNYLYEPGYKCLSCSEALHCFPGNFGLLVQCAGFFPFCRNGYCSRFRTDGCNEEYMFAEGTHGPLRVTTVASDKVTISEEQNLPTEVNVANESSPNTNTTEELTNLNKVDVIDTATVTAGTDNSSIQKDPRGFF